VHKNLQSPKKTVNHRVAGSSPAWGGEPAKSSTYSDYLRHLPLIQKNDFCS